MARAETIESVGETGGRGGNDPLPRHNTCGMELPRPFYNCPGLLTTTSGVAHHSHRNHHHLHPVQALYLSYPLPYPHPEDQDETRTHRRSPALSPSPTPPRSPLCNRRGGGDAAPSAFTGEQSDSHRDEWQDTSSRQGPLPDLLPQNELPSWASPLRRALGGEAAQEVEVRRVANQLRAIGDEFNITVLHRAHAAPTGRTGGTPAEDSSTSSPRLSALSTGSRRARAHLVRKITGLVAALLVRLYPGGLTQTKIKNIFCGTKNLGRTPRCRLDQGATCGNWTLSVCPSVSQSAGTDCNCWTDGHLPTCIFCKSHLL
ncbi:uncharacterized protein LOC129092447 [Anoplopoma fimbria]|uniref:uncharacterized protein LOC129092447 n=1 Tax=Anoplopoma fimbria TaxID=229290 RepID=UPI0023EBC07C|nr:uncharacterized protein LOC129092447 [Anoplopoma fimbria]